ncbi:MAG: arginine--tRNA ligase [Rhodospirillaceae bacterium]|nr:arginine--tRNA ligase [Rhodospirillaceae bacterium]
MNHFEYLRDKIVAILDALVEAGALPAGTDFSKVNVELTRDPSHGDLATNAAMVLAKPSGLKPHDLAGKIVDGLIKLDDVTSAEIAGPGFINIVLSKEFWCARLAEVLEAGTEYGNSNVGQGREVNVEYVSANPTGPMHVGHGRGAVIGDVLANLLVKAGFAVTKEYYINDAGAQVEALARSLHFRYREALGEDVGEMPEDLYPGDYLVAPAQKLAGEIGDKWLGEEEINWLEPLGTYASEAMMDLIRDDLAALGVSHEAFSSERELVMQGGVDRVVEALVSRELIYTGVLEPPKGKKTNDWEARPQTLFRATDFGDDVDRPIQKSDGSWTYFATDMAYHLDKFQRGFPEMIDVWGADHGGYVKRMQAAVKALTEERGDLDVKLCQMVNLMENGEPVKMSKRAGTFVTLREVIDQVGKDVVRFIMLTRKNDAALDFDLTKVMEQSRDNPVFYVQYSHARCRSVLRHATEMFKDIDFTPARLANAELDRLTDSAELALIKMMATWPRIVESAAEAHEPHRIAYYLHDLSSLFHALWTKGSKEDTSLRFLTEEDVALTSARLAMVSALATVIASGLQVMGVVPVEEM